MSLGLPPVSIGLKSITPFLQRAEELVEREPIVAYWSAYYAAQLGISLKVQDANSRNLLRNLLDALERLKKEIGPSDAVDIEPASAAYVENFALRVFSMADDEDRAGHATKSTAKKFLAAANFFEVLRVFPMTDVSESTENKLRYAKWKAVDIVKAFREGRRPAPGPAGSQLDPDLTSSLPVSDQFVSEHPPTPPRPVPRAASPPTESLSRSPRRQSPPALDIARANRLPTLLGPDKHDNEALSPGRWSTTATPGLELGRTPGFEAADGDGSYTEGSNDRDEYADSSMCVPAEAEDGTEWASTVEEAGSVNEAIEGVAFVADRGRGRVRFSVDSSQSPSPSRASVDPPFHATPNLSSSPPRFSELPPGFVPTGGPSYVSTSGPATIGSSRAAASSFAVPPPPSHVSHSAPAFSIPQSPRIAPSAPPASSIISQQGINIVHVPPYPPPPPREVELTPKVIARAQKHCRFAISALDYEDKQQAIKELKAALEALGAPV